MSVKLYKEQDVENIADAIRDRIGYEGKNLLKKYTSIYTNPDFLNVELVDNNSKMHIKGIVPAGQAADVILEIEPMVLSQSIYTMVLDNYNNIDGSINLRKRFGENYFGGKFDQISYTQISNEVEIGWVQFYINPANEPRNIDVKIGISIFKGIETNRPYEPYDLKYKLREMSPAIRDLPNKKLYDKILSKFPSDTATGNPLYLADSADMPVKKIEVQGNTEQVQYEGYNLLPYKWRFTSGSSVYGITITDNEDGKSFHLKGTSTGTVTFELLRDTNKEIIKDNVSYFLSGAKNSNARLYFNGGSFDTGSGAKQTYTSDMTNVRLIGVYISSGTSVDEDIYPMLIQGTTSKPYEPYVGGTASPNPEYPQEVKCVGQDVNLFDKNNYKILKSADLHSNAAITSTGSFDIIYLYLPKGEYIISKSDSVDYVYSTSTLEPNFGVVTDTRYVTSSKEIKIKIDTDKYFILRINANTSLDFIKDLKIQEGTTATPYSLYGKGSASVKVQNNDRTQEQTFTIPVQQEMCKIGDVKDRFTKIDGKWFEEHLINKYIFNGEEVILAQTQLGDFYRYIIQVNGLTTFDAVCSHYKFEKNYTKQTQHCYTANNQFLVFDNKTISELQKILRDNLTLYYIPKNPELIECTPEQTEILNKLKEALTYEGGTHISAESQNANPVLDVEYCIDLTSSVSTLELDDDITEE